MEWKSALRKLVHKSAWYNFWIGFKCQEGKTQDSIDKDLKSKDDSRCIQASDFVFGLKVGWRTCSCRALPAGTYGRIRKSQIDRRPKAYHGVYVLVPLYHAF